MQCPGLKDLIYPKTGKSGWPWNEESRTLTNAGGNGIKWPKISIVTPSLNQGRYIETTIRSVLLQGYPNLEYIIIDGGSTDEAVNIIKKYEKWLSYWVSETDNGQSNALNKGFEQASGEIYGYINSDDLYEPNTLFKVAENFVQNPQLKLLAGACLIFNERGDTRLSTPFWPKDLTHFLTPFSSTFAQPSSFWLSRVFRRAGEMNESLHYAFDQEFFLRVGLSGVTPQLTSDIFSRYRDHGSVKTRNTKKFYEETIPIIRKYGLKCGLSDHDMIRRIRKISNDIEFFNVFELWREKGRKSALIRFIKYMLKSPDFVFDRKVLGLARRLLLYRERNVLELKK